MGYQLPNFNLVCNIIDNTTYPLPRVTSDCNLAWGNRVNVASTGGTGAIGIPLVCMTLLLPPLTDVRGPLSSTGADTVECPAGSGRYYAVVFVDDIGKGFDNEHRAAMLEQFQVPTPLP
jgi:hypothetical protein